MSPGEARYTADLLYRCLFPLSHTVGTRRGVQHVVSLYLDHCGTLALVHRQGEYPLTVVERWTAMGHPPISLAQERCRKYVYEVYGRYAAPEIRPEVPDSVETERLLWRALHETPPAALAAWDEAALVKQACRTLAAWIEQDARAQGRPLPASWRMAQQMLRVSSSPQSPLHGLSDSEVRVWAHLLYEVGLSCQEGPLEALALLTDTDSSQPASFSTESSRKRLQAELFLKRLQHEVDRGIPDSMRNRMQTALNNAQLHHALSCLRGQDATRLPLRYSMVDLVLHGLIPRACALRAGLVD